MIHHGKQEGTKGSLGKKGRGEVKNGGMGRILSHAKDNLQEGVKAGAEPDLLKGGKLRAQKK